MYIHRTLSAHILEANAYFQVLFLTGPRQVGKTTLLQNLQQDKRTYISLDDLATRMAAIEDPAGFLDRLQLPVLIDEVQYAPNLFPYIKMIVDREKKPGLFWLTGSQQFSLMKNVSESLAGRVAIFDLKGLSLSEELGLYETKPFLPTPAVIKERQQRTPLSAQDVFFRMWRGSFPSVVLSEGKTWQRFYESYVTTYIERDIRDYLNVGNILAFRKFMQVAAARTGQMLNYREISKEMGVSEPTIKSWFGLLELTGLVFLLQPYFPNLNKRLIKTPKFYFMDTGLCCFLTKWLNPDVLENGGMAGPMLETYVVSEILKSYIHNGRSPQIYYYTDREKHEVDVLLEENGQIHPIEIKKSASIRYSNFKGFDFLQNLKRPIGAGCVLSFNNTVLPIGTGVDVVPIGLI
ncbi:MAG: hypothetical protein A2Y14_03400 [Verrucomicrobia bacterium GWF2_51_19]|nr:MAG: hypothetical protein A2Y14_03400 [Verrucomicrobia bacterium GWF2_51_19]